ncbi:unnamed protein product [Ectocarpus sp. 12 AP-2014]
MAIRRVGSTAESLVDGWAPSLAEGTAAAAAASVSPTPVGADKQQHMFDTVSDAKSNVHLPGGAAAAANGSGSRGNLSRFADMLAGGAGEGEIGVGETGGNGDGEPDGVSPVSEATAEDGEEQTTLPLGRPASTRSGIPDFGALSENEAVSSSTGGESGAMADASSCDSGGVEVGDVGGCRLPPRMADVSKPISLDDLRFVGDEESASSDVDVVVIGGDGDGGGGVVIKGAEKLGSPTGTGSTCEDATGPSSRASSNRRIDDNNGGGESGTMEVPSPSGGMSWVPAAPAMVAPATPAPAPSTSATPAMAEGSAAVTDNRISPFYADNSSLWATAAAVSARAEHATNPTPDANPFWSNSTSSSLSEGHHHHVRSASAGSSAEAAAPAGNGNRLSTRLRRAASGVSMLPITASSRVFSSRRFLSTNSASSAAVMMPPAPHSSQEPQSSLVLSNDKLGGAGGASHHIYDPADKVHHIYDPAVKDDIGKDGRAPAFGGYGFLGKTPLVSPLGSTASTAADETSSAGTSPAAARTRFEIEGDIEEGGTRPASADGDTAAVAAGRAAVADGSTGVAAVADVEDIMLAAAATAEQEAVLPCAPTDEEKMIYRNTGRFGIVTCAVISFITLTWGMWLFTIVTPAFYWFGGPAIFLIFYTACHYFGIAMWGRDFKLDEHAEVLKASEEKGYVPSVDVFLPVCKEPLYLLANTWKHVAALDYPDLKVFVLDDGASDEVKALASVFGFEYVVRSNAPELKKAGNLRNAFGMTSGEAIAIFDADFCPRPDFLKETVAYLGEDPAIGIVQTPQYFRVRDEQTWIEQGAGVSQEFFYRMVQMNQDRFNAAVCVGSCGLYRRTALEPLGGMAAIEHSEDMYTGYRMTEYGFKIKYVPLALAMGICPEEPQSYFMQQYRWCKGSSTLIREKEFWKSGISNLHKLCFLNGMLYYMATALLIFMAPIPIMLLVWMEADGVLWYHSGFVMPSLIFAGIIMPLWSKQRYGSAAQRVKVLQCYAHLFAIKDTFMGTHAPWLPSGSGSAKKRNATYTAAVRLMIVWNLIITSLIVGGSAWRMTMLTWYHFLPAIAIASGSFVINMSTLIY